MENARAFFLSTRISFVRVNCLGDHPTADFEYV